MGWNPRPSKAVRRVEKIHCRRAITSGVKSRVPLGMLGLLMLRRQSYKAEGASFKVNVPNQDAAIVTCRCQGSILAPHHGIDGAGVTLPMRP